MRKVLPSKTAELLITQKCNLNCTYCFEKCKSGRNIDFDECVKVLGIEDGALPFERFYFFGGEPFMNLKFVEDMIEKIENSEDISENEKRQYIGSIVSNLITNGTLADKHLDFIKKYKITLQVSLDGPEDVNDACRVDYNGKGHFPQIMKNLELCRQNGIGYTLHGACSRVNYKNFRRICEFFLQERLKQEKGDFIENVFFTNFLMLVIEDEITDDDIDVMLQQIFETTKWILETPLLDNYSEATRRAIAQGFLLHTGGVCSSGFTMYSYDDKFNVFPCHRLNTAAENLKANKLTSLVEDDPEYNYAYYEQFQEAVKRREMYGAVLDNFGFQHGRCFWLYWCPATNWEVSGNVFHIPSKYNVLLAEIQRFIPMVADYFDIDISKPREKRKPRRK